MAASLPGPASRLSPPATQWRRLYSKADARACARRVTCVAYDQPIDVLRGATVTATSAGFSLGSAVWAMAAPGGYV